MSRNDSSTLSGMPNAPLGFLGDEAVEGGSVDTYGVDGVDAFDAVAADDRDRDVECVLAHGGVFLVVGARCSHGGGVEAGSFLRELAVGVRYSFERVFAGTADRRPAEGGGQVLHAEDGQVSLQSVESFDVLVERGESDTESLGDGGEGELFESDFVGDGRGLGDDPLGGESGAGHQWLWRPAATPV